MANNDFIEIAWHPQGERIAADTTVQKTWEETLAEIKEYFEIDAECSRFETGHKMQHMEIVIKINGPAPTDFS